VKAGAASQTVPDAIREEKSSAMKLSLRSKFMILVLALFPATSVLAANDSHKGDLNLGASVQVAGKQLKAGDYVVKWDGSGPTAQVNFTKNGKVVATVPARVVQLDQKASQDMAEINIAGNGDRTLTSIKFHGKTYALEIGGEAGGAVAAGDTVK